MSLGRRLFRLWIVLSFAYVAGVAWIAYPSIISTWDTIKIEPKWVAETAADPHHDPADLAAMKDGLERDHQWLWGMVQDKVVSAVMPPLLALALGWGVLWALAPRKAPD